MADPRGRLAVFVVAGLMGLAALGFAWFRHTSPPASMPAARVAAGADDGAPSIRLAGTVEAVRATTVAVPRLAGQSFNNLVITYLVPPGTKVAVGDLLVEFDRQEQLRSAMDRRAEVVDLVGQ